MNDSDFKGLSRAEKILENMLGATNNLKPPQSRVEALLMELLELIVDISHVSGTVFRLLGEKEYIDDLPETGNEQGDVWFVKEKMAGFIWIIREDHQDGYWEELGEVIDTASFVTTEQGVSNAGKILRVSSSGNLELGTEPYFIATFGETTIAELNAAFNAGKALGVRYDDSANSGGVYTAWLDEITTGGTPGTFTAFKFVANATYASGTVDFYATTGTGGTTEWTMWIYQPDSSPTNNSANPITSGGVYTALANKQNKTDLVTSLSSSSTDSQYPSAKCVYDAIIGAIEEEY